MYITENILTFIKNIHSKKSFIGQKGADPKGALKYAVFLLLLNQSLEHFPL